MDPGMGEVNVVRERWRRVEDVWRRGFWSNDAGVVV